MKDIDEVVAILTKAFSSDCGILRRGELVMASGAGSAESFGDGVFCVGDEPVESCSDWRLQLLPGYVRRDRLFRITALVFCCRRSRATDGEVGDGDEGRPQGMSLGGWRRCLVAEWIEW